MTTDLLVSIHDVTGAHEHRVRRLWDVCMVFGVTPALLVVPNWHGLWPLGRHRTLVGWMRTVEADGAEILLHGDRHDEQGLTRRWSDGWRSLGRTAREGEFLTLAYDEARLRITRGLEVLRDAGLSPSGFVPPAWLARAECYQAAADAGLRVSEDAGHVFVLNSGLALRAPVLRWSARTSFRAAASAVVCDARSLVPPTASVARIALHPTDLNHPWTAQSLRRALRRWTRRMHPTTYAEIVTRVDGMAVHA